MPLEYDSIPLAKMSPDSSLYVKGLQEVINAVPVSGGGWREIATATAHGTLALNQPVVGSIADPAGTIFFGTTNVLGPTSRLYEYDPNTQVFTNRTPGVNYAQAPAAWRFTKFGATVIATPENNGTVIAVQARSGAGNFAPLVTSPDRPAPRFITTSRSHVVGAHNQGGAGLYASANPYQFMWCARNNAAIWTPGTDRAGFFFVNDALGELTGVCGFKDYFLLFQEHGVARATWIGGDAVWELQEVAGAAYGMKYSEWAGSIVKIGSREAVYFSNAGPAIVVNGEQIQLAGDGDVQRYFVGPVGASYFGPRISRVGLAEGDYEPSSGCVVWSVVGFDASIRSIVYHVASDRFSVLDLAGNQWGSSVASWRSSNSVNPLESFVLLGEDAAGISAYRFAAQLGSRETAAMQFTTKRWRPATGFRASLRGVRVLLVLEGTDYPEMTVIIRASPEPRFGSATVTRTITINSSSLDPNGWLTSADLPLEGAEFEIILQVPDIGIQAFVRDLPAIELAYSKKSVF